MVRPCDPPRPDSHLSRSLPAPVQSAGASRFGTIATSRFISALGTGFPRFKIHEEIYASIVENYGIGYKNPFGQSEQIGWMDFCEDVSKAVDETPEQVPTGLAHTRGAGLSFASLAMSRADLIDL